MEVQVFEEANKALLKDKSLSNRQAG